MTEFERLSLENNFDDLITDLPLELFQEIHSQSTKSDKRSLLACQLATRNLLASYVYLEIGSYLGGSIQPFLLDPRCKQIYSIDKRSRSQLDERGPKFVYQNNSTERMLKNLSKVSDQSLHKVICFDQDASEIESEKIILPPNICFIDGEHTDAAVWTDFEFCFKLLKSNGVILFHDAAVVYNGLQRIVQFLKRQNIEFNAYNLPDAIFVIEIGDFPLHSEPQIAEMLLNNHVGYLASLQSNDFYRQFVNKPIVKQYRQFRTWLSRCNVSK